MVECCGTAWKERPKVPVLAFARANRGAIRSWLVRSGAWIVWIRYVGWCETGLTCFPVRRGKVVIGKGKKVRCEWDRVEVVRRSR